MNRYPGEDSKDLGFSVYFDVYGLVDLPDFDAETNRATYPDDGVGFVVEDVEENDEGLENVEEDRPDGETFERFTVVPEFDICEEKEILDFRTF